MQSPFAVSWVESVKSLLVNQGNVKPNMTRLGDRARVRWRSSDEYRVSYFNPT
ncbi:hypothetical protein [Microcoleus sp. B3-D7]|uniref:hypothetical protein n=1 Tax=Microcoleus sp. B3-D7 TaxID=2818659 RepID=UPI002FD16E59